MEDGSQEKRPADAANDDLQPEMPDGKRRRLDQQLDDILSADPLAELGPGADIELDAIPDDLLDGLLFLDDPSMIGDVGPVPVPVPGTTDDKLGKKKIGANLAPELVKSQSMIDMLRPQIVVGKPSFLGNTNDMVVRNANSQTNLALAGNMAPMGNIGNISATMSGSGTPLQKGEKPVDAKNLNDALAVAGVDLQQEEELLAQLQLERRVPDMGPRDYRLPMRIQKPQSFLYPGHLAGFMHKIAKQNGVAQNFFIEMDILELMLASCESWLSGILTKTVIHSRHRRRNITSAASSNSSSSSSSSKHRKPVSSVARSELSRELRNLANRQKELEEKRVLKRIALGLEKSSENGLGDDDNKAGVEETLHRAANATAAMMTTGKKKYSWATSGAGSDETGGEKDGKGKQSAIISRRGDNGLRFREIRTGAAITMKDLLTAIENERMGTTKALVKGYAKLKD